LQHMSKRFIIVAGVGLVVLLLGMAVVVPALAEEPAEEPCPGHFGRFGWGLGLMGFGARGGWAIFDAVAEALELTPEELFGKLHGGETLADIAGDDLDAVLEAVNSAKAAAMQEAIEQAVKDGRLTQEQADWLLKGRELGFMHGGRGFRRGTKGRLGGFIQPRGPLTVPTTPL
jgi:hypothetical protein